MICRRCGQWDQRIPRGRPQHPTLAGCLRAVQIELERAAEGEQIARREAKAFENALHLALAARAAER